MDERLALVKSVGEEIINEEELTELLKKKSFSAYDGFEPSGRMHIAQAIFRAINVNKMIAAGAEFTMFVADWHAWANKKLGGDLEKIQNAGKYFIEVWKASGMDLSKVKFVWASELVKDEKYWGLVMQIATSATLNRVLRTTQIMGRSEKETLHASQILYPCMQAADIFHFDIDVCQLGMDQRKVNMLARELAGKLKKKKPIVVSHHMLMGLSEPPESEDALERAMAMKMSKSRPDTAIFIDDDEKAVERKIKKAYCPEGKSEENPVLEYCKYILFEINEELTIERPEKFGGNVTFKSYANLEEAYLEQLLHPADLKTMVAKYLNLALQPIRDHFSSGEAKKLKELVESYAVTR